MPPAPEPTVVALVPYPIDSAKWGSVSQARWELRPCRDQQRAAWYARQIAASGMAKSITTPVGAGSQRDRNDRMLVILNIPFCQRFGRHAYPSPSATC